MNLEERIKYAKEKAKESAQEIFKEKPEDIKEELEKDTTMGNPENLVKPDNQEE